MSEEQFDKIISAISEVKMETVLISNQIKIVDKRLSLIEQRIANIEPFISVDNAHLIYNPETHAAQA